MSFIDGYQQTSTNKKRARSPSPQGRVNSEQILQEIRDNQQSVYLEQQRRADEIASNRLQQEAADTKYEGNINTMIGQINGKALFGSPYVELDYNDPLTRYVIGMVVITHGMTNESLGLLQRSPVLFRILQDHIGRSRIGHVLCAAGSTAAECARLSRDYLASGLSRVASVASSRLGSQVRPTRARSRSPPHELVYHTLGSYPNRAPEQHAPTQFKPRRSAVARQVNLDALLARHLSSNAYAAPASAAVSRQSAADAVSRQSAADALLARQLSTNAPLQINALQAFESAQSAAPASAALFSAPAPAPLPQAPVEEEYTCSICMEPARDNAVLTRCNHRFHSACVTPWLNSHRTCPMCRNINPTPLVPAPAKRQRQGGGGSRKTRSKSKSKTRRLRKSRNKSRSKACKSYKSRKPRSSSRRK